MSATLSPSRQSTPSRGARELTPAQQSAQDRIRERIRRNRSATPVDPNAPKHPRAEGRIGTPGTNRGNSLTPGPQARLPKLAAPKKPVCTNVECEMHDQVDNPSIIKEDNGDVICGTCGVLISESHIAADATFQEGANGQASLQGTQVAANQDRGHTEAGVNQILGVSDSGLATRNNANAEIRSLAARLGFSPSAIKQLGDRAWRIWTIVYGMGRTKGRERKHVCAVCLYMATRTHKSDGTNKLLLIDFADLCDVSVFYLGRIYQDFVKLPGFREEAGAVHAVNAENLIHRYVGDLDVPGALSNRVANEAIAIFRRMDRDWMTTGRKPSGLCGAAVLLAFRMNNLRRTVREVVYTAKVCEVTINQRLQEFANTAAGKLTVSEYRSKLVREPEQQHEKDMDYENYREVDDHGVAICAPPAFYKQNMPKTTRKRKLPQIESTESDVDDTDSMVIDPALDKVTSVDQSQETPDPEEQPSKRHKTGKKASPKQTAAARKKAKKDKESMPPPPPPIDPALLALANREYANMTISDAQSTFESQSTDANPDTNPGAKSGASASDQPARESSPKQKSKEKLVRIAEPTEAEKADYVNLEEDIEKLIADPIHLANAEAAHKEAQDNPAPEIPDKVAHAKEGNTWRRKPAEPVVDDEDDFDYSEIGNHPDLQPIQVQDSDGNWQSKVYWPTSASVAAKISDSEVIGEDEFEDDPEVEDCFLDEEERVAKSAHWTTKYGEYLRHQHLKKIARLLDEANGVVKTRSKRNKAPLGDVSGYEKYEDGTVAKDMGEVYQKLWANRAPKSINSKINWDVLREVFNEEDRADGSKSPSNAADGSPSPDGEDSTTKSKNTPIFSRGDLFVKKAPRQKAPSTRAGREAATAANKVKKAAKKAEKEKEQAEKAENERASRAVRQKRLDEMRIELAESDARNKAREAANNTVVEETVMEDDDLQNMDPDQMTEEQKAEAERIRRLQMGEEDEHDEDDFHGLDGMDSDDENEGEDDWDGEEV